MNISRFALLGIFLFGLTYAGPVQATPKSKSLPPLPFEQYFASQRGDQDILKFNDFSGKIKAQRIKKLLRSGPVLGDRVLLQNNTAIYFPEGFIVSATQQFEKWRPRNGLDVKNVSSIKDVEINPDYSLVKSIDSQLGRVCAELPTPSPSSVLEFRKSPDGMISFIRKTKGRFDHILGEESETLIITSALSPSYLSKDKRIQEIAARCI